MLILACYIVPVGPPLILSWIIVYAALQAVELLLFPMGKRGLSTATPVGYVIGLMILRPQQRRLRQVLR